MVLNKMIQFEPMVLVATYEFHLPFSKQISCCYSNKDVMIISHSTDCCVMHDKTKNMNKYLQIAKLSKFDSIALILM